MLIIINTFVQSNFGYGDSYIVTYNHVPQEFQLELKPMEQLPKDITTYNKKTNQLLPYSAAKRMPTTKIHLTYCILRYFRLRRLTTTV